MLFKRRHLLVSKPVRLIVTTIAIFNLVVTGALGCTHHGGHAANPYGVGAQHVAVAAHKSDARSVTSTAHTHHTHAHFDWYANQKQLDCDVAHDASEAPSQSDVQPIDCLCCSATHCFSFLVPDHHGISVALVRAAISPALSDTSLKNQSWRLERPPKHLT